jgi:predicted  nucleic acid-binding Zn-ribbon protein
VTDPVAGAPDPFERLLELQDLDTHLSQLQHRRATLPSRAELVASQAALADLDRRSAVVGAQRDTLAARQAVLEEEIAAVNRRRSAIEERMYGARGTAARDLQAMDEEVKHLADRRRDLEDHELTLMEEQEPVDAELAELADRRLPVVAAIASLTATVAEEESAIDAELAEQATRRRVVAAALPDDLAARYETLRTRLKGMGAARLVGNHCDGCHLELPSVEIDRIRHLPPDAVVTCDQCGRILVRARASGTPPAGAD